MRILALSAGAAASIAGASALIDLIGKAIPPEDVEPQVAFYAPATQEELEAIFEVPPPDRTHLASHNGNTAGGFDDGDPGYELGRFIFNNTVGKDNPIPDTPTGEEAVKAGMRDAYDWATGDDRKTGADRAETSGGRSVGTAEGNRMREGICEMC
jgi:hypothetical protein